MKIVKTLGRFFGVFTGAYRQLAMVRFLVWFGVGVFTLAVALQVVLLPKNTNFAFVKEQCVDTTVALPHLQKTETSHMGKATYGRLVTVGGIPIMARSVCYEFDMPPQQDRPIVARHALFGFSLFAKKVSLQVGELPRLKIETIGKTISTAKPLVIGLTRDDSFFDYSVTVGAVTSDCVANGAVITCDVTALKLEPAKQYEFAVSQEFNNQQASPPAAVTALTANPVVISTTTANGATVYDAPNSITLTADRELQSVAGVTIAQKQADGSLKVVEARVAQNGKAITITWASPLPRQSEFVVTVAEANAPDGGILAAPFNLQFKTSSGPQIVAKNIGDRAVPVGQRFVLTLSQIPKKDQDFNKLFGLKVGEANAAATVTVSGKTVTITPKDPIDKCVTFQLRASEGIKNEFDVTGGTAWTFNSRVTCATTFSIGASVKGRGITAYRFGLGSSTILFNGNLHGNESNTKRLLDAWIYELEGNPSKIPAGKSVVVIPLSNPDGYVANSRVNANGVDLNRNFGANNWKSTVKMPSGETLATGGGTSPMSEPESAALANYISAISPRLVMSYHSQGNVVVANDAGNSWNLTKAYSAKSGYGPENGSTIGNFFDYDTTGAMEDWLADKKGIAAILVELATRSSDEFSRNKNAMWQMVTDF